ncbi:hypothetical protein E2562_000997 [Oryza meyeriana var. granulata]|uniref:Uncharacterized protein n=1 Tax=Oryza meyeriana var. granulata TaxID=110450 RepID=A0A6G1CXN5_9ORYZ|nr:hypothetical protein E2562_000997 [Oryza meyeriana var. granulata]
MDSGGVAGMFGVTPAGVADTGDGGGVDVAAGVGVGDNVPVVDAPPCSGPGAMTPISATMYSTVKSAASSVFSLPPRVA